MLGESPSQNPTTDDRPQPPAPDKQSQPSTDSHPPLPAPDKQPQPSTDSHPTPSALDKQPQLCTDSRPLPKALDKKPQHSANAVKATNAPTHSLHTKTSDPRDSKKQNSGEKNKMIEITENVFSEEQRKKIHHFVACRSNECSCITSTEMDRIKNLKKERFQHEWLCRKSLSYCQEADIWWACYVEGEGMYCLLCRKHARKSMQNKSEVFAQDPSVRYKPGALSSHSESTKHKSAIQGELLNRGSIFQKEIDERDKCATDVLKKAFMAIYWLAKQDIANSKIVSLIDLCQQMGLDELEYFQHRSRGSLREMLVLIGEQVAKDVRLKVGDEAYGLLIDDVADISNTEQMVTFIQHFDSSTGQTECKFLSIANVLAKSDSANAKTLHSVTKDQLQQKSLPINNLKGLSTDGAAVMLGKKNGLGALLKNDAPDLVVVHCICHKLALACTDTCAQLKKIKTVEVEVTQLWRVFDNSPKKLSVYLKIQQQINHITMKPDVEKKITRRLKKACQTRWLSFDNAISAVIADLPAILQTLRELKSDAACYGLLKKFSKPIHIGTMYILHSVLPILSELSKTFQRGSVNFARIDPALQACQAKLETIADNKVPLEKFQTAISEGGALHQMEVTPNQKDIAFLEKLLKEYVASLIDNISKRFSSAVPVLTAMAVFNPNALPEVQNFTGYGKEQIETLASHYYPGDDLKKQQLLSEWSTFMYDLKSWSLSPDTTSPVEDVLLKLAKQSTTYNVAFPLLVSIIKYLIVIPVSNAWPERGASKVKLIKTRLRSLLSNDMLNALMHISINGPPVKDSQSLIETCVAEWLSVKSRRKLRKPCRSKATPVQEEQPEFQVQDEEYPQVPSTQQVASEDEVEPARFEQAVLQAAQSLGLPAEDSEAESDYFSDFSDDE